MRWPLVSRGYAALVLFLALVAQTVFAGSPCPPKPPTVPSGPVVLKNGMVKVTPIVDDVTRITVQRAGQEVMVLYNDETFTFNTGKKKVCGIVVDARGTTDVAEVLLANETSLFLEYKGGAGAGSVLLAGGDAELIGGVGDLSATLGGGKVYVEAGSGTSYVTGGTGLLLVIADDVGTLFFTQESAGYSLIETGSGDAFITATAGEGAIFVTDPAHAYLDVTDDYCIEDCDIPCWLVFLFLLCW